MSDVPTRLLRETLRGAAAPHSSPECLDAEMLAAWADGALSARERAAAESHASSCGRCQALLAAMVRTLPPAPERKWWQTSTFGWLVPIAVGAIAVVVWINVPTSRSQRLAPPVAQEASPANRAPAASSASAGPAASSDLAQAKEALRDTAPSPPPAAIAPPRSDTAERRVAAPAPKAAPESATQSALRSAPAATQLDQLRVAAAAEPPAAPPPPQPSQNAAAPLAADAAAQPARPIAPAAGSVAPAAAPLFRQPALAEQPAGARAETMAKALAATAQIVAPNSSVRWRIAGPGRIDRSTDGGTTWQTQATGVLVMLTAGAAPSPTVCWLIGPAGIVVVSTDGRTWQRVVFPETIDLASVRATDAVSATVTAVDGRTFVTSDGGKSWRTP